MEKKVALDKIIDDMTKEKNRLVAGFLDEYSLGNGQFQILNAVAWNEGISQEGVVQKLKIDKSACAKSVRRLIENDFIFKVRDEKDKRAYCLHCTDKGKEMIPIIRDIVEEVDQILTSGMDKREREQFSRLCALITENARRHLNGTRRG
ncbi:MAG: winged helix DNA-binding protein [Spirochaetales bacterium]|nr:winged helix DNA-binding protein [Spirochaetales bacterium]